MIVKNEEAVLPRCLQSLSGQVHEICILDTGSTDRTVEIAKAARAKLGHFEWCDDFAAARNASLELATGDWILQVDADDQLAQGVGPQLRDILTNHSQDYDAYRFKVFEHFEDGKMGECWVERLFRNGLGIQYRRRIHERPILNGLRVGNIDGHLLVHDGYTTSRVQRKGDRNIRLLRLALQDDPSDVELQEKLDGELRFGLPSI